MRGSSSILIDLLKLVGGFVFLWVGYTVLWPMIPDSWLPKRMEDDSGFEISLENEEKLGDFLVDAFDISSDENIDWYVDSSLRVIEDRLMENIGLTDYEYTFHVIDDPTVNALTLPGGNIVLYTGLIKTSETPEEVAAVLAHEIGHAEQRHVVDKLLAELGISFVMAVITGGDATLINEVTQTLVSNVFSRHQEREADAYGLELMERSGIDPRSLAAFFRRMNRKQRNYPDGLEWMMTHPNNNSRIKASLEYEVSEEFSAQPFDLDWQAVKDSI